MFLSRVFRLAYKVLQKLSFSISLLNTPSSYSPAVEVSSLSCLMHLPIESTLLHFSVLPQKIFVHISSTSSNVTSSPMPSVFC